MDLKLEGRVALVAAASSGLGLAAACALAAEGAHVAICARGAERLARAHAIVDAAGPGKVRSDVVDMSDPDAVECWVRDAGDAFDAIDIVVGNTAGVPHGWAEEFTVADYRAALDTTMLPHVALVLAAAPRLRAGGWGRVLMITSESVRQPAPHNVLSGVARVGVLAFARNLVHSFCDSGVTVNVLAPGYHRTPALKGPGGTDPEELGREVPLATIGEPADFGALTALLAGDQAKFVTGSLLLVDGGNAGGLV